LKRVVDDQREAPGKTQKGSGDHNISREGKRARHAHPHDKKATSAAAWPGKKNVKTGGKKRRVVIAAINRTKKKTLEKILISTDIH